MSKYEIYTETSTDPCRDDYRSIESFTITTGDNSTKIKVDEQVLARLLLEHLRVDENLEYYLHFPEKVKE